MKRIVLDASVFVSAISPSERHHESARKFWLEQSDLLPFVVPSLFRTEVIAALARRGESDEFLDTIDAIVSGSAFHTITVDSSLLDLATSVARQARLRAYDAVYVALASRRGETLCTLDSEILIKARDALPGLSVMVP